MSGGCLLLMWQGKATKLNMLSSISCSPSRSLSLRVCVYIYIHLCVCVCVSLSLPPSLPPSLSLFVCMCVHVRVRVCSVCVCVHMYRHVNVCTWVHMHSCTLYFCSAVFPCLPVRKPIAGNFSSSASGFGVWWLLSGMLFYFFRVSGLL